MLSEQWIQNVIESLGLPPVSPATAYSILPVIELQLRKIIQSAEKFRKRSKKQILTGIRVTNISISDDIIHMLL